MDKESISDEQTSGRLKQFSKSLSYIWLIAIIIIVINYVDRAQIIDLYSVGIFMGAVYKAVGMAFLFVRSDTHLMGLSRVALFRLYLYVVIQILSVFPDNIADEWKIILFIMPFIIKPVLWFIVHRLITKGELAIYLDKIEKSCLEARALRDNR
ncbi:MAG: hypothetical protein AB1746_02420 [Candidatus Zixiibacteriota bacterium]